jgi:hypothetical protein
MTTPTQWHRLRSASSHVGVVGDSEDVSKLLAVAVGSMAAVPVLATVVALLVQVPQLLQPRPHVFFNCTGSESIDHHACPPPSLYSRLPLKAQSKATHPGLSVLSASVPLCVCLSPVTRRTAWC